MRDRKDGYGDLKRRVEDRQLKLESLAARDLPYGRTPKQKHVPPMLVLPGLAEAGGERVVSGQGPTAVPVPAHGRGHDDGPGAVGARAERGQAGQLVADLRLVALRGLDARGARERRAGLLRGGG